MSAKTAGNGRDDLHDFELRSPRMELGQTSLRFTVKSNDGQAHDVINISESGLAFTVKQPGVTWPDLAPITVYLDGTALVYQGTARRVWSRSSDGGMAIGVAFASNHLQEGLLEALEKMTSLADEHRSAMEAYGRLPQDYLAFVHELKAFLAGLKSRIDMLEERMRIASRDQRDSFQRAAEMVLGPEVVPRLVGYGSRLNELARDLRSRDVYKLAKDVFRRELHEYYKESPFVSRAWQKPLGYAGDFEMMNQIYRDQYEGSTLFSRLMHKWGINEPSSQSVRFRRGYLRNKIEAAGADGKPVTIGSLACGPAREVADFLEEVPVEHSKNFRFVLMDQDREALLNAKRNLVDVLLRRQLACTVAYVPLSVKDALEGSSAAERIANQRFDLLYTAGLYDYLTQPVAKMLTAEIFGWLRAGGELIVGNFHPSNPSHTIGDFAGEWSLIMRTREDMLDLVSGCAPAATRVYADEQEIDLFLEATKGSDG